MSKIHENRPGNGTLVQAGDNASVAALLRQSRASHESYQRSSRLKNYPVAEQHVAEALAKRQAAHEADPDHTDPEWQVWQHRLHAELCQFYLTYSTIP